MNRLSAIFLILPVILVFSAFSVFNVKTVKADIPVELPPLIQRVLLDAVLLSNAFGSTPSSSNWNPNADLNRDGVINILDAILLANGFAF